MIPTEFLRSTTAQHAEIRAAAAWSLGELVAEGALPVLISSFSSLEMPFKIGPAGYRFVSATGEAVDSSQPTWQESDGV